MGRKTFATPHHKARQTQQCYMAMTKTHFCGRGKIEGGSGLGGKGRQRKGKERKGKGAATMNYGSPVKAASQEEEEENPQSLSDILINNKQETKKGSHSHLSSNFFNCIVGSVVQPLLFVQETPQKKHMDAYNRPSCHHVKLGTEKGVRNRNYGKDSRKDTFT